MRKRRGDRERVGKHRVPARRGSCGRVVIGRSLEVKFR